MGAAIESTKEAMSVRMDRQMSATSCSGLMGPSVRPITCAWRERAKLMASMVRLE